jgi:hypothetical protein
LQIKPPIILNVTATRRGTIHHPIEFIWQRCKRFGLRNVSVQSLNACSFEIRIRGCRPAQAKDFVALPSQLRSQRETDVAAAYN